MTAKELKEIIAQCMDEVYFYYGGVACGVCSEVDDFKPVFTLWCGQKTQDFHDVDDVMAVKFFNGKSLNDLVGNITVEIA